MVLFACQREKESDFSSEKEIEVGIIDSLEINHLGNLWFIDYDPLSERFLARGKGFRDLLIVSREGEVQSRFTIPSEGPRQVGSITSMDMKGAEIRVLEFGRGLIHFDTGGQIVRNIQFPFFGFHLNGISGDPYFELGEELAFLRPEKYDSQEDVDWDELYESGFQRMYNLPILEVLDTLTMKSRLSMEFPKESIYQDGNYYGWMFPTVIRQEKDWLLFFRGEMKFYHYREMGKEVVFNQTIELKVSDAVPAVGVPFQQMDDLFELETKTVAGRIYSIFPAESGFLVLYKKGFREDELLQFNLHDYEGREEMQRSNPYFLAVFDPEFNLIRNELVLPKGIIYSDFLSPKGNLLGLKDQDYFGVEEEKVIYYEIGIRGN